MSAAHIDDEALQQLHDGALDSARLQAVQAHLSSCEQCSGRGAALDRLQRLLRLSAEEVSAGIDSDALFARISSGIAQDRSRAAAASAPRELQQSWLLQWVAQHRWVPATGVMLAAAAAVLLTLYKPIDPAEAPAQVGLPREASGGTAEQASATGEDPAAAGPEATEAPGAGALVPQQGARSEVVEVDFGSHNGVVFEVAMGDGRSTPVVWINDDMGE